MNVPFFIFFLVFIMTAHSQALKGDSLTQLKNDNKNQIIIEISPNEIPGAKLKTAGQNLMLYGFGVPILGLGCTLVGASSKNDPLLIFGIVSLEAGIFLGIPAGITGIILNSVGNHKIRNFKRRYNLSNIELDLEPKIAASQYVGLKYSF